MIKTFSPFFKVTCKEKICVSSVIATLLASCLRLPRAWSGFNLRPYLERLLLFLLAPEAAVFSSDACGCISSRQETLGLGGEVGRVHRCISSVPLQSSPPTPRWRACKGYKTPILSSLSFPSPSLRFSPSLFSRLFPQNAFQAVSTVWGRGGSSAMSEIPFFSGS